LQTLIDLTFSETISQQIPGMGLGILVGKNVTPVKQSNLVHSEAQNLTQFILHKFAENRPAIDPVVSAVRRMYRRIGWEPTQYRPAAEALIRRIWKGMGLYQINNLVDLANIVSTRYHLPMGLYDLNKITGGIVVDVGRSGETYQGIFKEVIHAEGKLVLRDENGVFGNPTADSARTSIDMNTANILALFYIPAEIEQIYIDQTLYTLAELYHKECPSCTTEIATLRSIHTT
jgi:DNA/RNA-binding domain of Phe-tRNA-synthetase-like protein